MQCPNCGSTNVHYYGRGDYLCKDCGAEYFDPDAPPLNFDTESDSN